MKKQIHAWCMYDWANSAFATTIVSGVLPIYFASIVVPDGGFLTDFSGTEITLSATTLWGFVSGLSALFVFFLAPVLGAIADVSRSAKRFLSFFCYLGSLFTAMLFFCSEGSVYRTLLIFFVANIGFVGGNVFYDSFLTRIADERDMDWISGKGYAYGYLGGGIHFLVSILFILFHSELGMDRQLAMRIVFVFTGFWWGAFALVTFAFLKEQSFAGGVNSEHSESLGGKMFTYVAMGVKRTYETIYKVRRFKELTLFLIAYMLYNDGIQTVIKMAAMYGKDELGFSDATLLGTLLMVQFVGIGGALFFGWLAQIWGAKKTVIATLMIWSFVVVYAFYMTREIDFWVLGVIVGLILGGSQALSRSLYASMIPAEATAEFFGFYSVFAKFSAIWGPFVFSLIDHLYGSSRYSLLSIIFFFAAGMVILLFVDEEGARLNKTWFLTDREEL